MQKQYIVIVGVSLFFSTLFILNTIHSYELQKKQSEVIDVFSLLEIEVPEFRKKKKEDPELLAVLTDEEKAIKQEKTFGGGMTREQLGNHGWAMLHMISATLPEFFDNQFVLKINVFLNLFGQFYPCKECAGHFLTMIKENPYMGSSREDFMQYMCKLHNFVNERLQKPIYECSKVHDQWGGYCGCEEEFKKSVEKYSTP